MLMIHEISLIIFLLILVNDIMKWIDMSWGDICFYLFIFEDCWSICMCIAFINCWKSVGAYVLAYGCYALLKSCWKRSFLTLKKSKVSWSLLGEFLNCSTIPIYPPSRCSPLLRFTFSEDKIHITTLYLVQFES